MEQSDREWADLPTTPNTPSTTNTPNAPQQATNQENQNQNTATQDESKMALRYVLISLAVRYVPIVASVLIGSVMYMVSGGNNNDIASNPIGAILPLLVGPGYIASWVIAIIARSKFKKAKSPKVLLIVYIIELLLGLVAIAFMVFLFLTILESCREATAW